jgi:hypothetical protein
MWLAHGIWQERVEELLHVSQLVVMIIGEIKGKDGLAWEVCQLLSLREREKVILVVPPLPEEVVEHRWLVYHEVSRGLISPYQGGEVAARFGASGECRVVRFGCRQDGDYLVALGDLIGPAPSTGATWRPTATLMDKIRDLVLWFAEDPDSDLLNRKVVLDFRIGGMIREWFNPSRARRSRTWIERLTSQLGALRLATEIHADKFTPERLDRIHHALHEVEESLDRCVQLSESTSGVRSDDLDGERQRLLEKLEDARARIRREDQPEDRAGLTSTL